MIKTDIPIKCPCLLRVGNWLIATNQSGLAEQGIKHLGGNCYSYPESVKGKPHLHWIIQADGLFRKFNVVGYERAWLRPIRFIWPCVRVNCELKSGRHLTVGELRALLDSIGRDGASSEDELRLDLQLRDFLKGKAESDLLTQELVFSFLNAK